MTRTKPLDCEWTDVYHELRKQIDQGDLTPGAGLPTIASLARSTGLTPYGARRALEKLCRDGRAQSWQGKGYRVAMPMITLPTRVKQPVFGDRMRALGFASSSEVSSTNSVRLRPEIARRMQSRSGEKAIRAETLRKVHNQPIAISVDYFPRKRFGEIGNTLHNTKSVSRALVAHGVPHYTRDHTDLTVRFPNAHEALILGIPRTQPVYVTVGANLDPMGQVVQVSQGIWRADCVRYEF